MKRQSTSLGASIAMGLFASLAMGLVTTVFIDLGMGLMVGFAFLVFSIPAVAILQTKDAYDEASDRVEQEDREIRAKGPDAVEKPVGRATRAFVGAGNAVGCVLGILELLWGVVIIFGFGATLVGLIILLQSCFR